MTSPTIKQRIEQNLTIWFLGTLLMGFVAGVGAYRSVQEIAGLEPTAKSRVAKLEGEISELRERLAESAGQPTEAIPRGITVGVGYDESRRRDAARVQELLVEVGADVTLRRVTAFAPTNKRRIYYRESRDLSAARRIRELLEPVEALNVVPYSSGKREFAIFIWLDGQ